MHPNPNTRKGGPCNRIVLRVLRKFGGLVETDTRKVDDTDRNI